MAPVSFSCTMLVSSCIVKCLAARCRLVHCKRGGCWRTVFLNRVLAYSGVHKLQNSINLDITSY